MQDYLASGSSPAVVESRAFYEIAARTDSFGKEWTAYLDTDIPLLSDSTPIIDYALHERLGDSLYASLNEEQKAVVVDVGVDEVLFAIERRKGGCIFVGGPGGGGKTFAYTVIYHLATDRRFKAIAVAWTGIVANPLPRGRTATSTFRLIVAEQSRAPSMKRQSREARNLSAIDVVIWGGPYGPETSLGGGRRTPARSPSDRFILRWQDHADGL